jgi:acyl carrier protein
VTIDERLQTVFEEVFDRPLALADNLKATDIEGWDSVMHISLMFGIENEFGLQFSGNQLAEFENIGALKAFLRQRAGGRVGSASGD